MRGDTLIHHEPVPQSRSWLFTYPAQIRYEPGPWLFPKLINRLRFNQVLLRIVDWYRVTRRPSLVKYHYSVNERVVEAPFVIRNIEETDRLILDIGSCGSIVPLELAHLGFSVCAVDQRRYPIAHPNLRSVQGDVRSLCFPSNVFDVAICLSTLEHVGMGHYEDPVHGQGDVEALKELWRVLKPGGKLLLTAPSGKACHTWQRVYDPYAIGELLSDFHVESMKYFKKIGESWLETSADQVRDVDCSDVARAVVLVRARKPGSALGE